jgi:methionyl-tRNA formyltransferase
MVLAFMGTPVFAVPGLQRLIAAGYDIRIVITQPDRPKGRGRSLVAPPIKVLAEQHQIPVLQPEKVRAPEVQQRLREIAPDAIVVIAYGQILPESILQIPRLGCINVHASLLPKYRGAAPIQWAIVRGERQTGVTIMLMDKGMDTGAMLLQRAIPIEPDDTTETLQPKLAQLGADLLCETLSGIESGAILPVPQDHAAATYAPLLKKTDGLIQWQESAARIYDQVRGFFPWPGAHTFFQGKLVKLLKVTIAPAAEREGRAAPGTVVAVDQSIGPLIATGDGVLRILEIQPENKPAMLCRDFCRGYHLSPGTRFGA